MEKKNTKCPSSGEWISTMYLVINKYNLAVKKKNERPVHAMIWKTYKTVHKRASWSHMCMFNSGFLEAGRLGDARNS